MTTDSGTGSGGRMIARGAILLISLVIGGWLLFDGLRAFVAGSYTTPGSGEHAGQLGPWAGIVSAVGLDPEGFVLRSVHVALGTGWLAAGILLFRGIQSARRPLLLTALLSLWYLPFGTIAGVTVAALLLLPSVRRHGRPSTLTGADR